MKIKILIILLCLLFINPCYALTFKEYINSSVKKEQSKEEIKEEWKQILGVDVWDPYFRVDEFISKKTTIQIGKFKGKLFREGKNLKYIFKYKF